MTRSAEAPVTVFSRQWHLGRFAIFHLLALLLLASYMLPPGYTLWREFDQWLFFLLNGSLAEGGNWTRFWAWSNVRALDMVPALVMLASMSFHHFGWRKEQLQPALIGFFLLLLFVMLPLRILMHKLALAQGFSPLSPSQVLEPAYLFSDLASDIPAKDRALNSFPGDHATVVLCWASMLALNIRQSAWRLLPFFLAGVFMLPRLVGGAHWASDNLVGGLTIMLLVTAWAFYTPLLQLFTDLVWRICRPLINLFGRIPVLGLLPFFNRSA